MVFSAHAKTRWRQRTGTPFTAAALRLFARATASEPAEAGRQRIGGPGYWFIVSPDQVVVTFDTAWSARDMRRIYGL